MYVELKHINKHFGNFKASDDVSLGIEKGKLIGLLGPSGSGKTTILRMIAGLETPDNGDIIIDGKVINKVPASKRGIGFVFQSYALFRYMTVFDNIAFGLKVGDRPKSERLSKQQIADRVHELLELVGLSGLDKRYPSELSGGQRQRVAFARALAPNPQLLLLDEPFAAIDAKVRQELRHWLKQMITKLGVTSIFVTHDQDEAIEVADEIVVMNHGRIEQTGTPIDIYSNPNTAFVSSFFGQPSIVKNYGMFRSFDAIEGADYAVIRPEFVKITKKNELQKYGSSAQEGVIEEVAFRGSGIDVAVRVNGELLIARRTFDEAAVTVGEKVDVFVYRIFVTVGSKAILLKNKAINEPIIVI